MRKYRKCGIFYQKAPDFSQVFRKKHHKIFGTPKNARFSCGICGIFYKYLIIRYYLIYINATLYK